MVPLPARMYTVSQPIRPEYENSLLWKPTNFLPGNLEDDGALLL
jgi:hypothetical protein